jgi:outer membrane protein
MNMEKMYKVAIGILAVAVVVLFVLFLTDGRKESAKGSEDVPGEQVKQPGELKVAYVFVDSVLANYDYYKVLTGRLMGNKTSLEQELASKGEVFQKDVAEFQRKVDKKLITSWDAEAQQKKLSERQQVLVNLQTDMQDRLLQEEQSVTQELHDSVMTAVKDVNNKLGYNIILSNTFGGGLLYAENYMNITPQVLDRLNESYRKLQGK